MADFIIGNWDKIFSLLFSLVAIFIALISSRQTSKQASLQIEEIRKLAISNAKDADRQIESIKDMTREATEGVKKQMIGVRELAIKILEASIMNLEEEIQKLRFEMEDTEGKYKDELDRIHKEMDKDIIIDDKIKNHRDEKPLDMYEEKLIYLKKKEETLIRLQFELSHIKKQIVTDYESAIAEAKNNGTYENLYREELYKF